MKPFITRSDIAAAECRLAQTQRESRESFVQLRSAMGSRLAQPSSLFVVTGVGVLLGVWFARRNAPRDKSAGQEGVSAWAPIVGVAFTLLIRFGMQRLADTWTRLCTSDPQRPGTKDSTIR